MTLHIADRHSDFLVINVAPDFCVVNGNVVPFDIVRDLTHDQSNYAKTVQARGEPVLVVGSVVNGVEGDAGAGVISGVALGAASTVTIVGSPNVLVEGRPVCRHGDLCVMNAAG